MESRYGAIVLCGGESRRLGRDKALVPFGGVPMIERMVRIVGQVVPPHNVVVVAGAEQRLPPLPEHALVIRDQEPARGPLPALLAGLCELPEPVEAAFVTGCDAPLLKPAAIAWLLARLDAVHDPRAERGQDAVAPEDGRNLHVLCAAYRATCRGALAAAMGRGATSLRGVMQAGLVRAELVPVDELRVADPALDSLVNCNTREEFEAALQRQRASPRG
jgi:molybdopterin-guanine dinucleotide biosynthesis protein A